MNKQTELDPADLQRLRDMRARMKAGTIAKDEWHPAIVELLRKYPDDVLDAAIYQVMKENAA